MTPLLALVSQPVDEAVEALPRVDVAWSAIAPVLILVVGALLLLVVGSLARRPPLHGSYAPAPTVIAGSPTSTAVGLADRVQAHDRAPLSPPPDPYGVDGFPTSPPDILPGTTAG